MRAKIDAKLTGNNIRRIMIQNNIKVRDIQNYLSLTCPQTVYRWLNGESIPSLDNLYALSEFFQLPMDDIVVGNKQMASPYIVKESTTFYMLMNV